MNPTKNSKNVSISQILGADSSAKYLSGSKNISVSKVVPPEKPEQNALGFAMSQDALGKLVAGQVEVIIVPNQANWPLPSNNTTILGVESVNQAMTKILPLFDNKADRFASAAFAVVDRIWPKTIQFGKNVRVGPNVFIGENVRIGADTWIGANCVIENDVTIGENSILHPLVSVGAQTVIGNRCEIHSHTTIGSDGFGYFTDKQFSHHKIAQLGRVRIEDDVEIGANCAIDRGTLGDTVIAKGSKLDNLCHVAHNVEIGANSLLAGGFMVAGSSKIGARNVYGGSCVVTDHVTTADGVTVAGRSTVTNDIKEAGQYGGYPLQPLKKYLRNLAQLKHLSEFRRDIYKILKALHLTAAIDENPSTTNKETP